MINFLWKSLGFMWITAPFVVILLSVGLFLSYPNCSVPGQAMLQFPSFNWVCATPQFYQRPTDLRRP